MTGKLKSGGVVSMQRNEEEIDEEDHRLQDFRATRTRRRREGQALQVKD